MVFDYKSAQSKPLLLIVFFISTIISKPVDIIGFSSVNQINDIIKRDDLLWIATPGGVFSYSEDSKETYHYRNIDDMPYLNITTLTLDKDQNIWAGTESGYLYKIDKNGRIDKNSDYFAKGWNINDLSVVGDFLLIGSGQGFSLFDTDKMKVVQSSNTIGTFSSPTINVIETIQGSLIENDSLININRIYLGMLGGYAWYDIIYDDLSKENFYNSTIWKEVKDSSKFVYHIEKHKDSLITSNKPIISKGDSLIYIENTSYFIDDPKDSIINYTSFYVNDSLILTIEGITRTIYNEGQNIWIGTHWNFLHQINNSGINKVVFDGIRFLNTNRVTVSSNGTLWILPNTAENHNRTPNIGVMNHKDGKWTFHEKFKNNFGDLADWNESFGLTEDKNGDIWIGLSGYSVKKFDIKDSTWYRYRIASGDRTDFKLLSENDEYLWGKCDMIMNDSKGYLWMSTWNSPDAGGVLCYDPDIEDPKEGGYRYFFPEPSEHYLDNILAMSQDACGNIILGGYGGNIVMFSYEGDPIKDGVNEPFYNYQSSHSNTNLQKVYDIASAPDSTVWIASALGFYVYSNGRDEVKYSKRFDQIPFTGNVNSIEVGELVSIFDTTYLTIWCSSDNEGILKTTVSYRKDATGNINNLKIIEDSTYVINEKNGLISNKVNQIHLDKNSGYVWAATNSGVAAVFDGNSYIQRKDSRDISAFPNPYIKKVHKKITFQHLSPEAQVMVYTIDGKLIANINEDNSQTVKTGKEWTYYWIPSEKIKPGTYIYTGTTRKDKGYGKLLILP